MVFAGFQVEGSILLPGSNSVACGVPVLWHSVSELLWGLGELLADAQSNQDGLGTKS
jgi:hypothetical protein